MFIQTCDICNKVISRKEQNDIRVEWCFQMYIFCNSCGKPLQKFLERNGLRPQKVSPVDVFLETGLDQDEEDEESTN